MALESDRSTPEIFQNIVGNVQEIIRSEVRLAKIELKEETKESAKAAGMLGAGVVFGFYALGFFLLGVAGLIAIEVAAWLAALIVAFGAALAAAILISTGKKRMQNVPMPRRTIETMRENVQWAKEQAK